jgi:hypothetical protein
VRKDIDKNISSPKTLQNSPKLSKAPKIMMIPLACLSHVKRTPDANGNLERPGAPPMVVLVDVVYDRSGSMSSIDAASRQGLQSFIAEHKALACGTNKGAKTLFSLTTFDTYAETFVNGADLKTLAPFSDMQMQRMCGPRNLTRLIDTMYERLIILKYSVKKHIKAMARKVRFLHPKVVAIMMAITDGGDNQSHMSARQLHDEVDECKAMGIDIIFLGANQDAITTAATFGIAQGQALTYGATPEKAAAAFMSATQATTAHVAPKRTKATSAPTFTACHRSISAPQGHMARGVPQGHMARGARPAWMAPPPRVRGGGGGRGYTGLQSYSPFMGSNVNLTQANAAAAAASPTTPPPRPTRARMTTCQFYR